MRGLARFLLVVILLVLLAAYFGWLKFSTHRTSNDNINVEMIVDKEKAKKDADEVNQKVDEAEAKLKEKLRQK